MTPFFYIKVKVGKFLANIISGVIRDKEKRHELRQRLDPLNPDRCVTYLAKNYSAVTPIETKENERVSRVWACWLQGEEQAPPMVKNCIESIRRFAPKGYEVVLITSDNLCQYVQLPQHIIQKWEKKVITNTHFSDIVRIFLLAEYGGIWIDATCLLLSPIPEKILRQPLFMLRSHGVFSFTLIQSCFICSERNNYIIRKWCSAISAYWEKENALIHYFTLHLMFKALLQKDPRFKEEFETIEATDDEPMHFLQNKMKSGERYSHELMQQAKEKSFIQKLSYKLPSDLLSEDQSLASVLSKFPYTYNI